jgi:hypothetical protein
MENLGGCAAPSRTTNNRDYGCSETQVQTHKLGRQRRSSKLNDVSNECNECNAASTELLGPKGELRPALPIRAALAQGFSPKPAHGMLASFMRRTPTARLGPLPNQVPEKLFHSFHFGETA